MSLPAVGDGREVDIGRNEGIPQGLSLRSSTLGQVSTRLVLQLPVARWAGGLRTRKRKSKQRAAVNCDRKLIQRHRHHDPLSL